MNTLRVGVLMGGKSAEHEVSFNSGRTVCDHLDTKQFSIVPIYQSREGTLFILPWHFLHRGKTNDFAARLESEAQRVRWDDLKEHIDFIYLAVHGRFAEDGTLQGFLELLDIPYLGSGILASALCMNKAMQKEALAHAGIEVPQGTVVFPYQIEQLQNSPDSIFETLRAKQIKAPYIVKPAGEGSSIGVYVVTESEHLVTTIAQAASVNGSNLQPVLVEEKLSGMEFSCIVLTDYKTRQLMPLPPTEIAQSAEHTFFDYEQKYMPGKALEYTPPRTSQDNIEKIQQTSIAVTNILEVKTISRVDGFLTTDGRVVIFEANTLSGMGPASLLFRAAGQFGMSHRCLINHLITTELHTRGIKDALQEHISIEEQESMNAKKIRVAILMGGQTHEKEISLESGRNVTYKLSPAKHVAIPIFVSSNMELFRLNQAQLVYNSTAEIEEHLEPSSKVAWSDLPDIADFVFIALHGGKGENGTVQGTLEMLGLPHNGSGVLASALCMNKYKTNEFLHAKGFDTPKNFLISRDSWLTDTNSCTHSAVSKCGLPAIVKPHDDGCSTMVKKIHHEAELYEAVELIFRDNKSYVLIEECIAGMELTIGVIGNETPYALPPSQAVISGELLSIEEKFLPGAGENQTPAPLSTPAIALVQSIAQQLYAAIGCKGYARIDCFFQRAQESPTGQERVIILEINTLPGLTPATCLFHQAAEIGMKPMEFIELIIELGLQLQTTKKMALPSESPCELIKALTAAQKKICDQQ